MLQPNLDTTQPIATPAPPHGILFWLARLLAPQRGGAIGRKPRFARRAVAGQSLVELALSLPFLITLLLALLEIGFLIRSHLTVLYATREGARAEAAAGNTEPMNWPIRDNSALYYEQADGDTVMVNNVNAALQDERGNALFLSTYKADSTYGDPCQHAGANGWAHIDGTNCLINSGIITNFANWPVYTSVPAPVPTTTNGAYFQEVFQRLTAANGFSRQVMDGNKSHYAGVQDCPTAAPYKSSCGSNINNLPGNWNYANQVDGGAPNPWYPGYRCGVDPNAPSLDPNKVGSPDYYNQSPRNLNNPDPNNPTYPVTRDWVGVRIDYKHPWITPWFKIPTSSYPDGIILSDKSVYNLEPRPYVTGQNIICNNSPPV